MAKYTHKLTTTEQINIEGIVKANGTIIVEDEAIDVLTILKNDFTNQAVKITVTKKTEEEL